MLILEHFLSTFKIADIVIRSIPTKRWNTYSLKVLLNFLSNFLMKIRGLITCYYSGVATRGGGVKGRVKDG